MNGRRVISAIVFLLAVPGALQAQAEARYGEVQFVQFDDGMWSGVYAYVRAQQRMIERLDGGERPTAERLPEAIAEVERAYRNAAGRLCDADAAVLANLRDEVLARLN